MIVDYISEEGYTYRIDHTNKVYSSFSPKSDSPDLTLKFDKIMVDDETVERPIIGKSMSIVSPTITSISGTVAVIQEQLEFDQHE